MSFDNGNYDSILTLKNQNNKFLYFQQTPFQIDYAFIALRFPCLHPSVHALACTSVK